MDCWLHLKPSVVPLQLPVRNCEGVHLALLQAVQVPLVVAPEPFRNSLLTQFGWSLHVNPSVVPAHDPARYWDLSPQTVLLQVVHVPLVMPLAPFRNSLLAHFGWSSHVNPSVVPTHEPARYSDLPPLQMVLLQAVHVPLAVAPEPFRNSSLPHDGCALHLNPSVVPEHAPTR